MLKKNLNKFLLILQLIFSVQLAIYLIVPVYDLSPSKIWGRNVHSPYTNWKQNPLTQVRIIDGEVKTSDSIHLSLYSFKGIKDLYVIDSVESSTYNPFLIGRSIDDIQYLVRKSQDKILVSNASISKKGIERSTLKGIDLLAINELSDLAILDMHLNRGHKLSLIAAEQEGLFAYNQLISLTNKKSDILASIGSGKNLILLSSSDLNENKLDKIPVVREIRWEDPELYLDLSEIGRIQILSSDYSIDTLSHSLKVKLPNVAWFRFQVDFSTEGFYYISNPYFRYENEAFEPVSIKANNQLTIFTNLSWLIGIILLNLLINAIRKHFL